MRGSSPPSRSKNEERKNKEIRKDKETCMRAERDRDREREPSSPKSHNIQEASTKERPLGRRAGSFPLRRWASLLTKMKRATCARGETP